MMRKAYQTHVTIFQALSPCPDVTPTQFAVLCVINDRGPCALTVIVRSIIIDLATVRGTVERLKKRGLVILAKGESDRRQVIASLSAEGRDVMDRMIPTAARITEVTLRNLSLPERVAFEYLLEKIALPYGDAQDDAGER